MSKYPAEKNRARRARARARGRCAQCAVREADLYTISELATRWRVTRHVVTATIRAGRLQAFKVGERYYRIRKAEVIRYEQQQLAVAS